MRAEVGDVVGEVVMIAKKTKNVKHYVITRFTSRKSDMCFVSRGRRTALARIRGVHREN